jgi:hypothetical protein
MRRVNLRYNVPLWHSGDGANLYCDLICLPYTEGLTFYDGDTLLYDMGVAITIDGASPVTFFPPQAGGAVKVMEITGADGYRYLLAANMGEGTARANLPLPVGAEVLHGTPPTGMDAELDTGATLLLRLPGYAHRLRSQ